MKNLINFFGVLFIIVMLAGLAVGQDASLSSIPAGEQFTSAEGGFTINLPKKPTGTEKTDLPDERGGTVTWTTDDGAVSITFGEYLNGLTITTPAERAIFLKGFKETLVKSKDVKLISEVPLTVGKYRGKTYTITLAGKKAQMRIVASGSKYFSMVGIATNEAAGSAPRIFKALASFKVATTVVK